HLIEQYPYELKVCSLRGYLHGRNRNYAAAVADLTRAIEISTNDQATLESETAALTAAGLFFNRGVDRYALGDHRAAINDFTKAFELCDRHKRDDYRETLHFWRAETFLRLGMKREALADLSHVPDNFSFWTDRLRTKSD